MDEPRRPNQPDFDPRVFYAAERTFLAWIRTGLALMGFGFVVARFGLFLRELAVDRNAPPPHSGALSLGAGTSLVVLGVIVSLIATIQHIGEVGRLKKGRAYKPRVSTVGVVLALLLAAIGLSMAIYLVLTR